MSEQISKYQVYIAPNTINIILKNASNLNALKPNMARAHAYIRGH